jgi:SUN domain-containing protein 1/2
MEQRLIRLDQTMGGVSSQLKGVEQSYSAIAHQKTSELQSQLQAIRDDVSNLANRIDTTQPHSDVELRSQLGRLAERLGGVEGLAKEALENSKHAVKTPSGSGWWSQSTADGKAITIRSSDGKDVTTLLGTLVENAALLYSKDHIAKADFALYSAGGRIAPSMTSPTFQIRPSSWAQYLVGKVTGSGFAPGRPPVIALTPDNNVGNCWSFAGSSGQLGVILNRLVRITEVTIDHVPRELAMDIKTAPREVKVWGVVEGKENLEKLARYYDQAGEEQRETFKPLDHLPKHSVSHVLLSSFTYDITAPPHIQTFAIDEAVRDLELEIGIVLFQFLSNWGDSEHTCVYRVRVHGIDTSQTEPPTDTTS